MFGFAGVSGNNEAVADISFAAGELKGDSTVNLAVSGASGNGGYSVGFEGSSNADADVENVVIDVAEGNDGYLTLGALGSLETITVTGEGDLLVLHAGGAVESFDASAATGNISWTNAQLTEDAIIRGGSGENEFNITSTADVTVDAGAGKDTITVNTNGDILVDAGAGNDTITVSGSGDAAIIGGAGSDTINLNGSGTAALIYEALSDSTYVNFDKINGFGAGDVIDLSAFTFTGDTDAISDGSATTNTTIGQFAVTDVPDFYGDNAVAVWVEATNTYVFADLNNDGHFNAASDLVVQLVNVTGVTVDNFDFGAAVA
ncbi:calcium-binding protein [Aerobium aerolatum]|uniref:Uncharacterized protein n=1 Tax=Aquamicrobium aerolatum DSM 21857 TaxID=1121003 RepID=A0A1I3T678_9HYPH|nr:hypothetical protein [Aquamicrobium aerolatum]SFJ66648.1 hypothetical protein SAMN03080618_03587 [Aquamicrobium aerolatum DSM 21857]